MITLRRAALATAGVAAAGGLVFGAASAFAASPSSTPSASATATGSAAPAKPHAKKNGDARKDAAQNRARLFKRGAHGQSTVKDKTGQWVVHEWQVGKVGSINGSTVTVTDASGTTWTWTVVSTAKVHVSGKVAQLSAVKTGDTILLTGTQTAGANDARAVFDPDQSKLG
jgi:hypothetical protein